MAQPGSASGLGPEGRRFESCLPDHKINYLRADRSPFPNRFTPQFTLAFEIRSLMALRARA